MEASTASVGAGQSEQVGRSGVGGGERGGGCMYVSRGVIMCDHSDPRELGSIGAGGDARLVKAIGCSGPHSSRDVGCS